MPTTLSNHEQMKPLSRWWFFLWGVLTGLLISTLCAGVFLLARLPVARLAAQPTLNPIPDARVDLTLNSDGCGVERGEVTGSSPVSNLTWVVRDANGYSVLERSADGEYKYRYFASGIYTISINAWYEGRYHQISDEVNIDC